MRNNTARTNHFSLSSSRSMPNLRPKSERAPRALCWFAGSSVARAALAIIREILSDTDFSEGEHEVVKDVTGFRYPIKTLVAVESGTITVITNYPLKKGKINENSL